MVTLENGWVPSRSSDRRLTESNITNGLAMNEAFDGSTSVFSYLDIPPLRSSRIHLRPVRPGDYPFLYELAVKPEDGFRWRFRGSQPSFEQFVQGLRSEIHCMYLVERIQPCEPIGHVSCYKAEFKNRNAFVAIQGRGELCGSGLLMEAMELFVDFLFKTWEFEKLYAECPAFNMGMFRSGAGRVFEIEGILRGHERILGRSWDLYVLAIFRKTWEQWRANGEMARADLLVELGRDESGAGVAFEEFATFLSTRIPGLDRFEVLEPEMELVGDAGLDSIGVIELFDLLEGLTGILGDSQIKDCSTLGDVYFLYLQGSPLSAAGKSLNR